LRKIYSLVFAALLLLAASFSIAQNSKTSLGTKPENMILPNSISNDNVLNTNNSSLGFSLFDKDKKGNPTTTVSPYVYTNTDNLIVGAKYNPDNILAIWTESFNDAFPPTGWLNLIESGDQLWKQASTSLFPMGFAPHSGMGMAEYWSFFVSQGAGTSLISPVFSLTGGAAKIGFWMLRDSGYPSNADKVDIMINTTAASTGATLVGTINRSKYLAPAESGADGWYYYEFTIPVSFNTATNYIILKTTSGYGNDMYVDDVSVYYLLANNTGMVSVDIATPIIPGALIPKATVRNFGSAVQTFPVTISITPGGYTNTQTVTSLPAGSSLQVSFASWNPALGVYSVKVITQLSTDQDKTNDTLIKSVYVTNSAWTVGSDVPDLRHVGTGVGYSKPGNDTTWLFALGGVGGDGLDKANMFKYNVKTNIWSPAIPLPDSLVLGACAIVKDSLYMIAGSNGPGWFNYTSNCYRYDINAGTWTPIAPLPAAICWAKALGYQDSLIYEASGNTIAGESSAVYLYNTTTNTWRTCTPMPGMRAAGAFARSGDTLVYVGGSDGTLFYNQTYRGVISQTDRSVITWTTGASWPGGILIWKADAASWGSKGIIMTTGSSSTTAYWTPTIPNPCYIYSPGANTWTALANLPIPMLCSFVGSTFSSAGAKLIVAGGYTGLNVPLGSTATQIYTDPVITNIQGNITVIPAKYSLSQNYPNPFNPVTKINFALPKQGFVTLKIYDVLGREVRTLVNEVKSAGQFSVEFNASEFSSGVYFYRLETNGFSDIKRMMLIK